MRFRVDLYTNESPTIKMRITDLTTGKFAQGEGVSNIKLKEALMNQLGFEVEDLYK